MYGPRSDQPTPNQPQQQWSVHAEFTISHPGAGDPENLPRTSTERDDNTGGVRMTYTWTSNEGEERSSNPSSDSIGDSFGSAKGFQKGNLFFTSTPPSRLVPESSGYGSDLLSPYSMGGSLPRKTVLPSYNRKCRSTCNITLSTNLGPPEPAHSQCGRTQSLRCQTPSLYRECPNRYYGCGDPWCHHPRSNDEFACPSAGRISPVPENGEEGGSLSGASTLIKLEPAQKKDASVQTFEMIDKCTSPFLRVDNESRSARRKYQRRKTEPSSPSLTPDSLDSVKPYKKLTRSPNVRRLPASNGKLTKELSPADSKTSDSSLKKPRTVHIDVYCTGTDVESSDSSDESESKSGSTAQTVFESRTVKVSHKKAGENDLPFHMRDKDESEEDNASTSYPSKMSSYSTIGDLSTSFSSVPRSWTSYSDTSWKDTFSDIHSLMDSKTSFHKNPSIDETPELATPSVVSLHPSDSFEYANSEDKVRIKKMEEQWKNKAKLAPMVDQDQQKKMREYMEKKIGNKPKWESKESESDDTDDSTRGWTFVKDANLNLNPDSRSPFSIVPGVYTESRAIARKFGPVVNSMKKPGHHVGPAKNPDCLCTHCRSYWENAGYRTRTRSLGDPPTRYITNWKEFLEKSKTDLPFTDF